MDANIQKYRALMKVVEAGSFSRAAEEMSYSQSGISRMIKDLETEWGIVLLERDKSGVRLTSEGISILPLVRRIIDDFSGLERHVDEINGLEKGFVRIGTLASVAANILPKQIKLYKEQFPNIDFEIQTGGYGQHRQWIESGRVDCLITSKEICGDLDLIEIGKDEFKVVIAKDHKHAVAENFPIKDIPKEPFILVENEGTTEIGDMLLDLGIEPDVKYRSLDDYAVMAMVESDLGISIMNGLVLERCPYDVAIKKMSKPRFRNLCFATRSMERSPLAVRKFASFLSGSNLL